MIDKLVIANRGEVAPRVAATHRLDAVREAHEQFERREHVGKIVLVPPAGGSGVSREDA